MDCNHIISIETVKPSSPTPPNLINYKLYLLDQAAGPVYIPICLFYTAATQQQRNLIDQIRSSLSYSLSYYYPLAGRYNKDGLSIQCNHSSVTFIQAKVTTNSQSMSQLVFQYHNLQPNTEFLQKLLLCHPCNKISDSEGQLVLLGV
ncbi:(13S,14R)-1,13-dihydroxy-N-methylcanadine 13-O-acetyltransferase AT1 [Linum perenne]